MGKNGIPGNQAKAGKWASQAGLIVTIVIDIIAACTKWPVRSKATVALSVNLVGLLFLLLLCSRVSVNLLVPETPVLTRTPVPQVTPISILLLLPTPTPTPIIAPVSYHLSPHAICFVPDLALNQHIASSGSYEDGERTASTPMTCRIQRDSCAYNRLVNFDDPTIVFKQEEVDPFRQEDSLVHPIMVQKLQRLNQLVLAEWGGTVQLRVTDAYDSLLEHDPPGRDPDLTYSLHYEGRAVDVTTWPIKRELYGRLCALAHCAGFDWVLNEGTHCHLSIQAESLCTQCAE